jgi:hypothetical protein
MKQYDNAITYIEVNGTPFLHKIVNVVSDRDNARPVNALYIKPLVERIMQLYPGPLRKGMMRVKSHCTEQSISRNSPGI